MHQPSIVLTLGRAANGTALPATGAEIEAVTP